MHIAWTALSQKYFVKGHFTDQHYDLFLTDFKNLWTESMEKSKLALEIKARLPQLNTSPEKFLVYLSRMLNGSMKPVTFTFDVQENHVALTALGSIGPLSLSWNFQCNLVKNPQTIFEVLVDPLVRLSLLYQEREAMYLDVITKFQERMETMQSMFDLHGIQSGLQSIAAPILDWEATSTSLSVHSILSPLTIASTKVVKEEEPPKEETAKDTAITNFEMKKKRREELLKQSQQKPLAKKKRAF
jgi:hypothetical protein